MTVTFYLDMTPCSLVDRHERYRGTCCLLLQSTSLSAKHRVSFQKTEILVLILNRCLNRSVVNAVLQESRTNPYQNSHSQLMLQVFYKFVPWGRRWSSVSETLFQAKHRTMAMSRKSITVLTYYSHGPQISFCRPRKENFISQTYFGTRRI
jgi:hypothetical protein